MSSATAKHRVVIVGGGAGGLELATRLGDSLGRRGQADITLIDKNRTHVWKPKLHEIASGSMDMSPHEVDYLAQAHWHQFRYRIGEMTGIDRERREVRVAPYLDDDGRLVTPDRVFGYDTLVVALGSLSNDFGTPRGARACAQARIEGRRATLPRAWSTRASGRTPRQRRCGPSNFTWRSSVPAPRAWNWPPSCTARRARWLPTG